MNKKTAERYLKPKERGGKTWRNCLQENKKYRSSERDKGRKISINGVNERKGKRE